MIGRRVLLGALPPALLGVAACSVLPERPYPKRRDWALLVPRPGAPAARHGRLVLLVRDLRAGPGLEQYGLQTLRADGSLYVDPYEAWAVPPAEGAGDALRSWLAASGVFSAVLAPGSRATADLVLEGDLQALRLDAPRQVGHAALSVVLLDQRPGRNPVLLQRRFVAEVRAGGVRPEEAVMAERAALAAVFRQIEQVLLRRVR